MMNYVRFLSCVGFLTIFISSAFGSAVKCGQPTETSCQNNASYCCIPDSVCPNAYHILTDNCFTLKFCNGDQYAFNPETRCCDFPSTREEDCAGLAAGICTWENENDYLPATGNCKFRYRCLNGCPHLEPCQNGLAYDGASLSCNYPELIPPNSCCGECGVDYSLLPWAPSKPTCTSNETFCCCVNKKPYPRRCLRFNYFNWNLNCCQQYSGVSEIECCSENEGETFPCKENNGIYFKCYGGTLSQIYCPEGQVYCPESGECEKS